MPAAPKSALVADPWFAAAAPGFEAVVAAEVAALPGVGAVTSVPGGVEFTGDLAVGMRANRWLRVATRVLRRLGVMEARAFPQLRRQAAKLPWEDYLALQAEAPSVRFEVSARACRLYHTGAVAEALAGAASDRLRRPVSIAARATSAAGAASAASDEEGDADAERPEARIFARGQRDRWTISVDASGVLLHKRGWRTEAGPAPLRETLAAGLLRLAGYDPSRPLVDLMCGAGTIVIEAAAIAAGHAPGAGRGFAFERWPTCDPAVWAAVAGEVGPGGGGAGAIIGRDADPDVLALAARNATRAGVGERIAWVQDRLGGAVAKAGPVAAGPGLVVVNPPYGRRLGGKGEAAQLVRLIGQELRRDFAGWRAGVLLADPAWARLLRLPVAATHQLQNGGLRVWYVIVDVAAGPG